LRLLQGVAVVKSLPLVQQSHPDPVRGGRGNLWHTVRAQGNPLFRRRGHGHRVTVDPRGLPDDRAAPEGRQGRQEDPSRSTEGNTDHECGERHSGEKRPFLVPCLYRPGGTRTPLQKETRGWESHGARDGLPRRSVKSRRGRGVHWHQGCLGAQRALARKPCALPSRIGRQSCPCSRD